jgi:hypothetical protein
LEKLDVDGRILLKSFFNDVIKDVDSIDMAHKDSLEALVNA